MTKAEDGTQDKLIQATKNGDLATVRSIFNEIGDVKADDFEVDFRVEDFLDRFQLERGNSHSIQKLLHLAVYALQADVVSFLLREKKASVTARDQGKTPLHVAVSTPFTLPSISDTLPESGKHVTSTLDMIKLLVRSGADVNAVDNDGQTALHIIIASMSGFFVEMEELIVYLVNHGGSLSHKDKEGYSPFHLACSDAPARIVKLMLDLGASPTMPDNDGWTPLQMAACNPDDGQVLQVLLSAGATANLQSNDKNTPVHFSKTVAHAKVLFEIGEADLTIENKYGETPAQMALGRNRHDVAEYLQLAQDFAARRNQCHAALFVNTDNSAPARIQGKSHRCDRSIPDSSTTFNGYSYGMLSPVVHLVVREGHNADLVAGYVCLREALSRLA